MSKYACYILLFLTMILGGSCSKDWLDQKPDKNLSKPESLKDMEAMLDNSDLNGRSPVSLLEVGADGHYVLESRWQTGFPEYLVNAFTWSADLPNLTIADWNDAYKNILTCNIILEQLEKLKPEGGASEQWNTIKGGALFHRARLFFELSLSFSPLYDSATASTDAGIPLRLEADINIPSKRSPVKEVYDQILNDLQTARDLLPVTPKYKLRGSKASAYALLARVYLSLRNYGEAGKNAHESLQLYNTLIDYNTLDKSANYIGLFNDEVLFHEFAVNYNIITTSAKLDPALYDLFDDNDLRKILFFRQEPAGTLVFKGNYANSANPLFFGMTTAEMYLIRAESYARAGDKTRAMQDLNTLYRKRWNNAVPYTDLTAADADDALRQVLTERRKELLMRGQRWPDLQRLNKEPRFAVTLTRTIGGKTYTLEPNSYKYTLPIPDDVIQMSGMKQNPGW